MFTTASVLLLNGIVTHCSPLATKEANDILLNCYRSNNLLILVTNGYCRKAEHGAVGQVGGGDNVIREVGVDDRPECLNGQGHQDDEDHHPDDLPGPGGGKSCVAEASDGRVLTEADQGLKDDPRNTHRVSLRIVRRKYK